MTRKRRCLHTRFIAWTFFLRSSGSEILVKDSLKSMVEWVDRIDIAGGNIM
jgi:hypothetical protein